MSSHPLQISLDAPAKINANLRVLGKRDDGFHAIETLIVPLELADKISITVIQPEFAGPQTSISLECTDTTLSSGPENLAYRAAVLFLEHTGNTGSVHIRLEKLIPHGAGLGGGSSDAASVLIGLNKLFHQALSTSELAKLAGELGSDVAVFVYQSAAICWGRGEIVEPVAFPHRLPILLIKPEFGVPTPWAYSRWKDARELPGVPYAEQQMPWGAMVNDLERPVFEKFMFLAALKTWLLQQPETAAAMMSGSGSTVFAIPKDSQNAEELSTNLLGRLRESFGSELWCHLDFTRTIQR